MEKHCEHVTKIEDDYLKREFEGSEILPAHIVQLNNPYKLFSHFLSQDFFIRIVRETCIYSRLPIIRIPIYRNAASSETKGNFISAVLTETI
jgi:hypothetical protein